ncbi:MAG: alginate O-acetyltransferase AlgX-related protein [Gemmatimonadota bacterium]
MRDSLTLLLATAMAVFAWIYVALVLLLGRSVNVVYVGPDVIAVSIPLVGAAVYFLFRSMIARGAGRTVLRISLAVGFTVGGLLAADILYSFRLNARALGKPVLLDTRLFDPSIAAGELLPRLYFPTEANFRLHKPGVSMRGAPYGGYYSPELMESPTLEALFKPLPHSWTIGEHGFRDTTPIDEAEVFALGDSFTFGWGVDGEDSWVKRLQSLLGEPVSNLGVHDASPKQELELLAHLLRAHGETMRPRHVVWMIYEGNDLEDSYAERAPVSATEPATWSTLADGTVLEGTARLPWLVQRQAIIHRILSGEIVPRSPTSPDGSADRHVIDGVKSWYPLYRSATLGPRLFSPEFIERAAAPASYVLNHPNRPHLDAVFEDMAHLAGDHGFEVTVVIAPTAVRLHGPYYDGFPSTSEVPHFVDYVADLSARMGFRAVDLLRLFEPFADGELLYFRDDDHWNHRGHALAAEVIRREAFP